MSKKYVRKTVFSEIVCPTCKTNYLLKPLVRNSLSRRDNETYICNDCGAQEAWEDFQKREDVKGGSGTDS